MELTRVATLAILTTALTLGAVAAGVTARATGHPPPYGLRGDRRPPFRPLPGGLVVAALTLIATRDVAGLVHAGGPGALPPWARAAHVAASIGAFAAGLLLLNALARPRGLAPAWVLVLAAPLLYLLLAAPAAWALGVGLPLRGAWGTAVPILTGTLTGVYLFLATLVGTRERARGRAAAACLGLAVALQGIAVTTLAAAPAGNALLYVAAADLALVVAALTSLSRLGATRPPGRNRGPIVTLTPKA